MNSNNSQKLGLLLEPTRERRDEEDVQAGKAGRGCLEQ